MTRLNAANNAETTLTQAVGISDTTIEVYDASKLPSAPFMMSIEDEITKVTDVKGNVLTVERAMENTDAGIYDVGTTAGCRFTAGMYDRLVSDDELRKVDDKVTTHLADYTQFKADITYKVEGARESLITSYNDIIEM